MRSDPDDPKSWLESAREDITRANVMFRMRDYSDCLFHLQQAAEKFLKGRLIEAGWKLQRTHHLPLLITETERLGLGKSLSHNTAALLATEYIAGRYPTKTDDPEPSAERVRACIDEVSSLVSPSVDVASKSE